MGVWLPVSKLDFSIMRGNVCINSVPFLTAVASSVTLMLNATCMLFCILCLDSDLLLYTVVVFLQRTLGYQPRTRRLIRKETLLLGHLTGQWSSVCVCVCDMCMLVWACIICGCGYVYIMHVGGHVLWWYGHWNTQAVCVDVHSGTLLVSEAVCLTVYLHID